MINLSYFDVVILCGGLGKRLRPEIGESQKVMATVDGHPFLDILVGHLEGQGFRRVVLCTGFKAETVEAYFRANNKGLTIEFSKEEEPLGTGGALKNAERLIKSDLFVVLNGDCFCNLGYQNFFEFHQAKKAFGSFVVVKAEENKDFGSIVFDASHRISSFSEKQMTTSRCFISAGIYVFDKKIFSLMPKEKKFSLEYDCFPKLVDKGLYAFLAREGFLDIGTPERYKSAEKMLKKEK